MVRKLDLTKMPPKDSHLKLIKWMGYRASDKTYHDTYSIARIAGSISEGHEPLTKACFYGKARCDLCGDVRDYRRSELLSKTGYKSCRKCARTQKFSWDPHSKEEKEALRKLDAFITLCEQDKEHLPSVRYAFTEKAGFIDAPYSTARMRPYINRCNAVLKRQRIERFGEGVSVKQFVSKVPYVRSALQGPRRMTWEEYSGGREWDETA